MAETSQQQPAAFIAADKGAYEAPQSAAPQLSSRQEAGLSAILFHFFGVFVTLNLKKIISPSSTT